MAQILDGNQIRDQIKAECRPRVERLVETKGRPPGLAVVLVGFWELATRVKIVDPFFFGEPSKIFSALRDWVQHGTQAGSLEGIRRIAYDGTELPITDADVVTAQITTRDIDRGSYPHYLLKEIIESPASFRKTLRGKLIEVDGEPRLTIGTDSLPDDVRRDLASGALAEIDTGRVLVQLADVGAVYYRRPTQFTLPDGMNRAEIIKEFQISETEYDTNLRWLRRTVPKLREGGS